MPGVLKKMHIVLSPDQLQAIKHNNDIITTILQTGTSESTAEEKTVRDETSRFFGVRIGNG